MLKQHHESNTEKRSDSYHALLRILGSNMTDIKVAFT